MAALWDFNVRDSNGGPYNIMYQVAESEEAAVEEIRIANHLHGSIVEKDRQD